MIFHIALIIGLFFAFWDDFFVKLAQMGIEKTPSTSAIFRQQLVRVLWM